MSQLKPQQNVPMTADDAYESLRAESLYGQLVSSSCRRFWWYTGDLELTVGAWLVLVSIICSEFPLDGVSSVMGWLLFALSFSVLVIVPSALRSRVIIPQGVCISAPPRTRANRGLVAAGLALYAAWLAFALYRQGAYVVVNAVGAAVALLFVLVYARSGCTRHFVLAAVAAVGIPFVYQRALVVLAGSSMLKRAALGSSGVLASLGLGPTLPFVATLFAVGALVCGCGAWRLVHAVRERKQARSDGAERQRLIVGLASPDERVRFMTAAYLCEHPNPAAVVRLAYGASDNNLGIAATMRLALVRVWGPTAQTKLEWYLGQTELKGKRAIEYTAQEWHLRRDALARFTQEELDAFDAVGREVRKQAPRGDDLCTRLAALTTGGGNAMLLTIARLIGFTHEERGYRWLVTEVLNSTGDVKRARTAAQGFAGADANAVPYVCALVADKRGWVRACGLEAANALMSTLLRTDGQSLEARRCKEELHDVAFSLVDDPRSLVRARALDLLAHYGVEAAPIVAARCQDRSAFVRAHALDALVKADEYRADGYVFDALTDPKAIVREEAVRCAEELHLVRAMNRVVVLVNDPSEAVSSLANEFILISQSW